MRGMLRALAAVSAVAISATAANASTTVIHVGSTVVGTDGGTRSFYAVPGVGGTIYGSIVAGFPTFIGKGNFLDEYQFTVTPNGTGSGSLTSTAVKLNSLLDTDITKVWIVTGAGTFYATMTSSGLTDQFKAENVPIIGGILNTIYVQGLSRGEGHYQADLTFTPNSPVPEPATWAMMLVGFFGVGMVVSRRSKKNSQLLQLA